MNLFKFCLFLVTICLSLLQTKANAKYVLESSYATSTESLKRLLDVEEMLLENLEEYVNELKHKLKLLNRALVSFRAEELKMRADEEYFHNPLQSFALIRHQQEDWLKWAEYMKQLPGIANVEFAHEMRKELPTIVDLQEASTSIELLVDYHQLEPKDLAAGNLTGHSQPTTALSMLDCYALAKFNLFGKNFEKSQKWLNISLAKYNNKLVNKVYDFNESNILKYLAVVLFKNKNNLQGSEYLDRAISIKPDDFTAHYKTKENLRKLCPDSSFRPLSKLHCSYNNWMTPFLRLAPLKMEQLSMDPPAVLYYNGIYESEIEWFLNRPVTFEPSLVDQNELSMVRTAQNYHFEDDEDAVTRRMHRRLVDMTGFSMKGADKLSMINYGIGGHYECHLDAFRKDGETGNRIATVLFYLGHVESGGATVFPSLNLTVKPVRGTALFWHNLNNDGTPHLKSWHGACPVLVGTKYVLTKWIFSLEQLFIKPCLPEPQKSA